MHSSIRKSLALMVAGLGLSTAVALADPPAKVDPKLPAVLPKAEPKPHPMPLPTVPHVDPKLPVLPSKPADPVKLPKVDVKVPLVPLVPVDPKTTTKVEHHPLVIHEKPKSGGEMPKGPGLKLPAGTKIDHAELAKIKPPVDLTKTKPEAVLAAKPPADFKATPIKLDSIHVPSDAPVVEKLTIKSMKSVTVNQTFVLNKNYYTGGDYYLKYGTKTAFGYAYAGMWHSHWHHSIWDPSFSCYYFFDPSLGLYYYWCETDFCYYPCYWFVNYGNMYYPWWIVGGFGGYGYVARPTFGIFIGW